MDWLIAYRIAAGISMLLCLFTIWHLFRTVTSTNKRKIFWMQLSLLTFVDLLMAVLFLTVLTLVDSVAAFENWFHPTRFRRCAGVVWTALDFCSCFFEVEIALGFGFACRGWANVGGLLRAGAISTPLISLGLAVMGHWVFIRHLWIGSVLGSCALALLAYAWGASCVLTSHAMPWAFRRRILLRGLCYGLNVTLVFAPYTILYTLSLEGSSRWAALDTGFFFSRFMYFLNGAVNVCTYAFWMWRSHQRVMQSEDPEAPLAICESVVLDDYFYLSRWEPHDEYLAKKDCADAVARAREIRSVQLVA